jgi:hypothetical protein
VIAPVSESKLPRLTPVEDLMHRVTYAVRETLGFTRRDWSERRNQPEIRAAMREAAKLLLQMADGPGA